MKKIYVLMLSLCVAIAANAAASQLYIIGNPAGGFSPTKGIAMTQVEDGVFTYTLEATGDTYFGFADQLLTSEDWNIFESQYRYGATSANLDADANRTSTMVKPGKNSWKIGAGKWELKANTNTMELTVTELGAVVVEYAYAIHGNIWEGASDWSSKAMEEVDGKWVLTADCRNTGNFGIRQYVKGGDINQQTAWLAAATATDANLTLGTPANVGATGTNFNWGFAGESKIIFDPEAMTITVENGDAPEPEPVFNGITVFYKATKARDHINVYMWNSGTDENQAWPGGSATLINEEEMLWMYKVEGKVYGNVIFNVDHNEGDAVQTHDAVAVHGKIYTINGETVTVGENQVRYVAQDAGMFSADSYVNTTLEAVLVDPKTEKLAIDEVAGSIAGHTDKTKENFTLKATTKETHHEVFYRVIAGSTPATYAAAETPSFAGFVAAENNKIEVPAGNGELLVSTRVHGVLSTPKSYTYDVQNDVTTGVENIEVENGAAAEYFNLQGVRVANPEAGHVYIRVAGGKAVKVRL